MQKLGIKTKIERDNESLQQNKTRFSDHHTKIKGSPTSKKQNKVAAIPRDLESPSLSLHRQKTNVCELTEHRIGDHHEEGVG